jgi:hypothetical protein
MVAYIQIILSAAYSDGQASIQRSNLYPFSGLNVLPIVFIRKTMKYSGGINAFLG